MKPSKKRTSSLQSNVEEVQWCFGVAVLPLALGALNVCMKSGDYQGILERNVQLSVIKLGLLRRSWVLQQDNDLKHTSKSTQEWFKTKRWTVLKWPAMSPDLNPIEHLWGDLKTAVGRRHPSNLGELEQFAQEEWDKLPVERCRKLIHGFRKCLTTVILSKGCDTKY